MYRKSLRKLLLRLTPSQMPSKHHRSEGVSPLKLYLSCSAPILPYSWSRSAQKFLSVSVQQILCFIQASLCHCWQSITDPGKNPPAEAKLSWSYEMWKEEMRCCNHAESKGEVTDYKYNSSWTVLKHFSRSKNPYPCLHFSKLTYH